MTMSAISYLGALYGTRLSEGDPVVVSIFTTDQEVNSITVYEFNRTFHIMLILAGFVAITVIIGRKKGLQSLLGLAFTVLCLIFVLIPLLMKGFPTLITTFFVCVYVAVVSFIFIAGVTKKSACAMLGTFAGLALAVLFGLLAQWLVKVDGMRMGEYVDALLQLKQKGTPIQLSGLLIGGMIISTLGAVMDVAMSISSSMQELTSVNSSLTRKDLWRSGMNIGRDMIGTMTNTLILAFVGSSFLMVLYIFLRVPFTTTYLLNFFASLSKSYEEAATIDGCTPAKTFWQIMLPLVQPALITVTIFNFLSVWNEFFMALIFASSSDMTPVGVGLLQIVNGMKYSGDYGGLFAAVIIVFLPTFLLYIFLSEKIISGVTGGGVKG